MNLEVGFSKMYVYCTYSQPIVQYRFCPKIEIWTIEHVTEPSTSTTHVVINVLQSIESALKFVRQ